MGAKPDRAETSHIAVLTGFAFRVLLAVCAGVPAVVAAAILSVTVAGAFRAHFDIIGGLVLLSLDMGEDRTEMLVVGDRWMRDALLLRIDDGAGQGNALVPILEAPVGELVGVGVFANQTPCQIVTSSWMRL